MQFTCDSHWTDEGSAASWRLEGRAVYCSCVGPSFFAAASIATGCAGCTGWHNQWRDRRASKPVNNVLCSYGAVKAITVRPRRVKERERDATTELAMAASG